MAAPDAMMIAAVVEPDMQTQQTPDCPDWLAASPNAESADVHAAADAGRDVRVAHTDASYRPRVCGARSRCNASDADAAS